MLFYAFNAKKSQNHVKSLAVLFRIKNSFDNSLLYSLTGPSGCRIFYEIILSLLLVFDMSWRALSPQAISNGGRQKANVSVQPVAKIRNNKPDIYIFDTLPTN